MPTEIDLSRRKLLTGTLSEMLALLMASRIAMAQEGPKIIIQSLPPPNGKEAEAKRREEQQKALAAFPFERIEVPGSQALDVWTQYKKAGRGSPVVMGDDDAVARLAMVFTGKYPTTPTEEIIQAANAFRHPEGLLARHKLEDEASKEYLRESIQETAEKEPDRLRQIWGADATVEEIVRRLTDDKPQPPELGEWPANSDETAALSVPEDAGLTVLGYLGRMFEKVSIAIIPTDDWTTIPAYLHWGGWNACPLPEYHIAALRSWRDRYGAELVGLNFDTMNLRVARRPQTREEAIALAYEQHIYCNDIIDQGVGTVSALAAILMKDDWWYFWWD